MLRDFQAADPLSSGFRDAVGERIDGFLRTQEALLDEVGTSALLDVARTYTGGGKRLRPAFCFWGHAAAGGDPSDTDTVLTVAASLDVLHASALVHDDLIDAADTRRGGPAAHKQYEAFHRDRGGRGGEREFGASAAVLLGDMLLMCSSEMFDRSGAPALDRAREDLSRMRMEVTAGQFLDISAAHGVSDSPDALAVARKILEYKSASYSIRRPALIGARLGGASDEVYDALAVFGSHIGAAFQLRDDVLGVWGDEEVTGKPTGGDLREGKSTVLVLTALARADQAQAERLGSVLGLSHASADDIREAARIIEDTGARSSVEELIDEHLASGLEAISSAPLTEHGRQALTRLAELSVRRTF
jgi:geranylgeranyl diphosphate synthase, type I